jgi:hypothetical protein
VLGFIAKVPSLLENDAKVRMPPETVKVPESVQLRAVNGAVKEGEIESTVTVVGPKLVVLSVRPKIVPVTTSLGLPTFPAVFTKEYVKSIVAANAVDDPMISPNIKTAIIFLTMVVLLLVVTIDIYATFVPDCLKHYKLP